MQNISNSIEQYLKKLLQSSGKDYVDVQRSELAIRFDCVPSQINYVLTTRFSPGHGYIIESRRGGGGYIRIVKVPLGSLADLIKEIDHLIGDVVSPSSAEALVKRLYEEELITRREALLIRAAVNHEALRSGLPGRDALRAHLLKAMITTVIKMS